MRSVRSAFLRRASSSSLGRVVNEAVKRGWVSDDSLSSRRMRAAQVCGNADRPQTYFDARKLALLNIDIAAVSDVLLTDEGALVERGTDYILFSSNEYQVGTTS